MCFTGISSPGHSSGMPGGYGVTGRAQTWPAASRSGTAFAGDSSACRTGQARTGAVGIPQLIQNAMQEVDEDV